MTDLTGGWKDGQQKMQTEPEGAGNWKDTTAYIPVYSKPVISAPAPQGFKGIETPLGDRLVPIDYVPEDQSPDVPEGYMDSTNKPQKHAARPTGGLKVFVDAVLALGGLAVIGSIAIAIVKFFLWLWVIL